MKNSSPEFEAPVAFSFFFLETLKDKSPLTCSTNIPPDSISITVDDSYSSHCNQVANDQTKFYSNLVWRNLNEALKSRIIISIS